LENRPQCAAPALPPLKEKFNPDFIVVNGENRRERLGITLPLVQKLFNYGANAITTGDHVFRIKNLRR